MCKSIELHGIIGAGFVIMELIQSRRGIVVEIMKKKRRIKQKGIIIQ